MRLDFAPMEGITGYRHRLTHKRVFGGVDQYYMPFISPTIHRSFTHRELRDISPEHNEGLNAVPQVLCKVAEDVLWAAGELHAMGYGEVNLNLGCPSGTVVSKSKGSGMLRDLAALEAFLTTVYEKAPVPISIKTRLGLENPEEFGPILELFNRFPIHELTIHPRVRKEFYKGEVHMDAFRKASQNAKCPFATTAMWFPSGGRRILPGNSPSSMLSWWAGGCCGILLWHGRPRVERLPPVGRS